MAELLVNDHEELDALAESDLVWAGLAVHIRAEHLHLFPALLAASEGDAGPVAGG